MSLQLKGRARSVTTRILIAVPILIALKLGCARSLLAVQTPRAATESIPEAEIRQEMDSVHGGTHFGLALGLLGLPVGLVIGAKIGYEIGYQHDIQVGCEDCGLGGEVLGGLVGMVTLPVAGAVVGSSIDRKNKRAEAIRRIRARRARQTQ